jgi:hypothetical protein
MPTTASIIVVNICAHAHDLKSMSQHFTSFGSAAFFPHLHIHIIVLKISILFECVMQKVCHKNYHYTQYHVSYCQKTAKTTGQFYFTIQEVINHQGHSGPKAKENFPFQLLAHLMTFRV